MEKKEERKRSSIERQSGQQRDVWDVVKPKFTPKRGKSPKVVNYPLSCLGAVFWGSLFGFNLATITAKILQKYTLGSNFDLSIAVGNMQIDFDLSIGQ